MKKLFLLIIIIGLFGSLKAQSDSKNSKLSYMLDNGVMQAMNYAKTKSKPVLLFFNSVECHSCELFTEMVMTNKDVVSYAKNTFISVNANIENGDARRISRKYKAFMLPAVVLVSADQEFEFTCNLSLDKEKIMYQMKNFFNAVALREQILLLQKTNHLTFEEASRQIGASYAKIDFRKTPSADPEELFEARALGMKYFNDCGDAYFEEWMEQKTKTRTERRKD